MNKKIKNNSFLSLSLSKGFTSPNIPIATFYQGNKELNFVLDTGSDDNIISKEALQNIMYQPVEHEGTLAGVGGVYSVEACTIPFKYEDEDFNAKFLISDTIKNAFDDVRKAHAIQLHGMIGSKFLRENGIVLDFKNLSAYSEQ